MAIFISEKEMVVSDLVEEGGHYAWGLRGS